ncbi:MAG: glutaminase A [Marinifilaceae bacterium]
MITRITINQLTEAIIEAYEHVRKNVDGENASYIPYLEHVDKTLFGISVCLPSGKTISVGDVNYPFGIESISKVLTALLVIQQYGADKMVEMIGANATGLPFNSIMAMLLEKNQPTTPLVNAGAISTVSMVQPQGDSDSKWKNITDYMDRLCAGKLTLIDELYKSETETNYNNRSITWLLKKADRIYDDPEMSLDLYTRQCSLGVTTQQLAIAACTIANKGLNPISGEQIFNPELSTYITTLVATNGFYEQTGDWLYSSGVPAKSGVGGGVLSIVPGVMGIAAFAPPLDESGNSVRAQAAIKYIAQRLKIHVFNGNYIEIIE